MPLPWNRGDEEDSSPAWVDLLPLVGGSGGSGSGAERGEASRPVLVAPHRDPGEDAVNHDMPPRFVRSMGSVAAPDEESSSAPVEAAERPTREPVATDAGPRTAGPDPATPGAASLEEVVGDAGDASPAGIDVHAASAPPGPADRETPEGEEGVGDERDSKETVPLDGQ